jgi:hypothetical protein
VGASGKGVYSGDSISQFDNRAQECDPIIVIYGFDKLKSSFAAANWPRAAAEQVQNDSWMHVRNQIPVPGLPEPDNPTCSTLCPLQSERKIQITGT